MKPTALPTLVAWVTGIALCASSAAAAETTIEDFESSTAINRWAFSNGPEFPGAKGSLTRVNGHVGSGAHIAYDLTAGGTYVSATLTFTQPITTNAIAFWLKAPPRSRAKLRLYDSTGQTLEYTVDRPLSAYDANNWFRVVVDVLNSSGHYGGANDGSVHAPLTGMTVLSIPELNESGAPSGSIDIDDVTTLDSYRVELDPQKLALVAAPAGAASLSKNFAVNIHFTKDDRALDAARAAGFSAVRMDLGWSDIEKTRGVYDFSAFDALVAALAARGMRLHLILDYSNPLYPAIDKTEFMSTTLTAFASMARATAAHFAGKNVTYEVWNEPNGNFWKRSVADFAKWCSSTVVAVHAADAKALVATGGVSGFDFGFIKGFVAAGGPNGANAIGVHPYRQYGAETVGQDWLRGRAMLVDSMSVVPPLWDTEWGYSSSWFGDGHSAAARNRQAKMAARALLSEGALGLPLIVYYDLRDDGTDGANAEHNFGLLQNDYAEKPAMVAVRTLTALATSHTFAGFLATNQSSLHTLRFDSSADRTLAVWWDNAKRDVTLTLPAGTTGRDTLGAALSFDSSKKVDLTLRETDGPIYLKFASATSAGSGGSGGATNASGGATNASGGATNASGGATSGGGPPRSVVAGNGGTSSAGGGVATNGGVTTSAAGSSTDGLGGAGGAVANLGGALGAAGSSSGGSGSAGDFDSPTPPAEAGCACALPGTPRRPNAAFLAAGALGVLVALRRRRHRLARG